MEAKRTTAQQKLKQYLASIEYVEPETPRVQILPQPKEFVWIEDSVPQGANTQGNTPWMFVQAPAPVFSGQSSSTRTATGLSQHFFDSAPEPLKIGTVDVFFCYVHLDPKNPPREIMLQWNDGGWNHRAYWGGDHSDWGTANTVSRQRMANLPKLGEWVRLEVPAADVGFKRGNEIKGWVFTQFDGKVHWDKAGVISRTDQKPLYDSFAEWQKDQIAEQGKSLPKNVRAVVTKAGDKRSADESKTLTNYFLEFAYAESQKTVAPLQKEITENADRLNTIRKSAPTTPVFRERKEAKPAHMLTRGEYDQKGEPVTYCAGRASRTATGCSQQSPRTCSMADRRQPSTDFTCHRQSHLATVLWHRSGENSRGLWLAGRSSISSPAAGLAVCGIYEASA